MATISGLNPVNKPTYSSLNVSTVSKDASNSALLNKASSLGITSLDSYIKTDAAGNAVGVDRAKLNSDITTAKKAQKAEEEKIELKQKEENDSFVKTTTGKVKKEEVKLEASKNKISIDAEYKKALMQFVGIDDKYGEEAGTSVEKLEKELNQLKANKEKLMGATSSDLQVFEGAGKLLNKIGKFFTKADNVNISESLKEDNEDVFEIKSREEIFAEHNPLNDDNQNIYNSSFFASAFRTTQQ